jgi:hypothetical protein
LTENSVDPGYDIPHEIIDDGIKQFFLRLEGQIESTLRYAACISDILNRSGVNAVSREQLDRLLDDHRLSGHPTHLFMFSHIDFAILLTLFEAAVFLTHD